MEDTRRKSTTIRQLDLLITYMEAHRNLAIGQLRSKEGRALATRMWEECAELLNSEGVARRPKDWSKLWNDYKCRVRAKIFEINRGYRGTGGGPSKAPQLSPLEERVAALIGRDVGPLAGVRQDPEMEIEFVNADEADAQLNMELPAANSPILDISVAHITADASASQDLSRTLTIESEQRDTANVDINNQSADQINTLPPAGEPRHRQPRPTRSRTRARPRFAHQSNTASLDDAKAAIARIEEMRARTEEMVANTAYNMSNAMTSFSESMTTISNAITGISNAMTGISNAMTSMAETLNTYVSSSHTTDC